MEFKDIAPEIDPIKAQSALSAMLGNGFGEVYIESRQSSGLVFDQGRLRNNEGNRSHGVGVRRVMGTETRYAHSESLKESELLGLIDALGSPLSSGKVQTTNTNAHQLYRDFETPELAERLKFIQNVDQAVRGLDPRIINVTITLASSHQDIAILQAAGEPLMDARPMCRLGIAVTIEENGRRESGNAGKGGRYDIRTLMDEATWLPMGKEALRIALVNITAQSCPAGEQTLLLGPGWPGVLFHEAVGHGLEGDFNRRGSSAFSKLMGKRVASHGVNVIDDGTVETARGSLNFDDEGTATQRNTLIEDGILVGYMQDRQNAELMGEASTGNCRRESYAHAPMPRMTNTFLDNGSDDPKDLLANMGDGLYAVGFGGGQVDITSGKFVFNCTEAYRVEKGEIKYPVKGATLIGDGPTALTKIIGIGNDLALDPGVGNCGKGGQWVPVTVGQPSVLMDGITIGGTEM